MSIEVNLDHSPIELHMNPSNPLYPCQAITYLKDLLSSLIYGRSVKIRSNTLILTNFPLNVISQRLGRINPRTQDFIHLVSEDGKVLNHLIPRHFTDVKLSICPGRHFAELALYTTIVTMLATVNILKPLDKDGKEYMPNIEFSGNVVRYAT